MNRILVVLMASLAVLSACAKSAAPDTAADEAAIRESGHAWYKAYNAADMATLVALYSDDAVVQPPNAPAVRGGAAIREFFTKDAAQMQGAGLTGVEGATSDVGVAGDLAWQSDTYTLTDKSGATVESGKTLTVFERKNGKWLMIRDTWNADAPSTLPSPSPTTAPSK